MSKHKGHLADEGKQDALRGSEKDAVERLKRVLNAVLASVEGRQFAALIIYDETLGRLEHGSFTGSSQTFEFEGRRAVGIALRNLLIDHAPKGYLAMEQERLTARMDAMSRKAAVLTPSNEENDDGS